MNALEKIIFVDEENTQLSPFAACLLTKKLQDRGLFNIHSISRGNVVLFPEPANQKIAEIAAKFGISVEGHRAEQLKSEELQGETLVLTMDGATKAKVYEKYAETVNIYTIKEYLGEIGDITLPIGDTIEKYETVCETVARLLDSLVTKIEEIRNDNGGTN